MREVTNDLVVVVPGVMGSRLWDTGLDRPIWGVEDPRWYAAAWAGRRGLEPLGLTAAERDLLDAGAYDPAATCSRSPMTAGPDSRCPGDSGWAEPRTM